MQETWKKLATAALGLACAAFVTATPLEGAEAKKAKAKPYPLDTCLVSGEKLDADPRMKSHVFVHKGQEIKLCCKSCLKSFNKEPEKYLKQLEAARKPK
jgi:YHS domain-containing protein